MSFGVFSILKSYSTTQLLRISLENCGYRKVSSRAKQLADWNKNSEQIKNVSSQSYSWVRSCNFCFSCVLKCFVDANCALIQSEKGNRLRKVINNIVFVVVQRMSALKLWLMYKLLLAQACIINVFKSYVWFF